jgi:hypothetical protein
MVACSPAGFDAVARHDAGFADSVGSQLLQMFRPKHFDAAATNAKPPESNSTRKEPHAGFLVFVKGLLRMT